MATNHETQSDAELKVKLFHCTSSKTKILVTLIDANHVPGAVMILIKGYFGNILYCGDFRFRPEMLTASPALKIVLNREDLDELYLDNTFFYPTCNFPPRCEMVEKVMNILTKHPNHRVYIGLRKLGKEQVLVEIAKRLNERICITPEKLEMFEILELPDVFTTDPNSSRIHCVNMHLLKRKFLEDENRKQKTVGIMLTALYYGWDSPDIPYSISHEYNLHVVEYSDHSSYDEIIEFVQAVKPKIIKPIIVDSQAVGLMKEWRSFHKYRIDMSPLKGFLSRLPVKLIKKPLELTLKGQMMEQPTSPKKAKILQHVKHRIYYRGPKGPVYETLSDGDTTTLVPAKSPKKSILILNKLEAVNIHLSAAPKITKKDLNELNDCLDELYEDIN